MNLYHYYDKKLGPFRNLSDLNVSEANEVIETIKKEKPNVQCAQRHSEYMNLRLYYEKLMRELFIKQGGIVKRESPHYMIIEESPWLANWYENNDTIKIPLEEFDLNTVSFTYGDSHPTFSERVNDGKEYRKRLYHYEEILELIKKYGYPQIWNNNGKCGPERYIEVQIWSDETIRKYC